jgi:hypothetical protein
VPTIKRKIESGMPLTDAEIRSAAEELGWYANLHKASDAVMLVGLAKSAPPEKRDFGNVCRDPATTAFWVEVLTLLSSS